MIHFKSREIIFSLILCFLVSTEARKTNRDASQVGYSYEKPGKPLEIPKNINGPEEEVSTEEINPTKKTPVENTSGDEYLPPKTISLGQPSGGEDENSKQMDDKNKESPKIKRKSGKEEELSFQEEGSGGFKQQNNLEKKKIE